MANGPELIYCADGNKRFAEIAISFGFIYGARLPGTVHHPIDFADQDWENPSRDAYFAFLRKYKPRLATVIDWMRWEQLEEMLGWAEEAAAYVSEAVIIVPKVVGGIRFLPTEVGGRPVRLGYSIASGYGSTLVHPREFTGWPVHLLGGSPRAQRRLAAHHFENVVSVDGNYMLKMATKHNQFFRANPNEGGYRSKNRFWPTLMEANGGKKWGDGSSKADAPYEAFARSCKNIMRLWNPEDKLPLFAEGKLI